MGSGTTADRPRCLELGQWLATRGVHLLTGGGRGVMDAVSEGFSQTVPRSGIAIGILPASKDDPSTAPVGYPNPWLDVAIQTHLPLSGDHGTDPRSRNHINILTADIVIAMAGAFGTSSEVSLALRYGRPVVAYLQDPNEIPQLSPLVPVLGRLDEVRAFVDDALSRAP
ncbi:MAG: molybdenum cofactor carrier protein [Myxococcota bacterium]